MGWFTKILDWIFPPRCLFCGQRRSVNEEHLCKECAGIPTERVYRFFAIHERRRAFTLECRSTMRYRGEFRSTLHRFKFRDETHLAKPLAKQLFLAIDRDRTYDCIAAVPVSAERLKERGYDQSELLAKELSRLTGIPYMAQLTKKTHNRTQHNLPSSERERNVRGVYKAKDCTGLRVLLVDDIVTTGATVRECARMLYRAGADDVGVVCCALVL